MPNDIFASVERFLQNRFSVELETGEVLSVGALNAQVSFGGSNVGQDCSFNTDMILQRGDSVLLVRSKRNPTWVISNVIGRPRSGNSVISRPTPNNVPGVPRWVAYTPLAVATSSWSGTTLTTLMTGRVTFNGGHPALMINGYITPGASDVVLEIGWGEGTDNLVIFKRQLKSTITFNEMNIFDISNTPLVGTHTFTVRGQLGTGGITPSITFVRYAILEI